GSTHVCAGRRTIPRPPFLPFLPAPGTHRSAFRNGDKGTPDGAAWYNADMPDTASPSAPKPAMSNPGELRHTLTVEDVGLLLSQAGVPRSRRQIIRYCQTGLLEAVKVPGPTGDQWYVAPASLPKAIGDLKQWEAQRERQI